MSHSSCGCQAGSQALAHGSLMRAVHVHCHEWARGMLQLIETRHANNLHPAVHDAAIALTVMLTDYE
jgi:hypothetical protein